MNVLQAALRFALEEEGAGVIEYSLIAGIMAAIVIAALYGVMGKDIQSVFKTIGNDLTTDAGG